MVVPHKKLIEQIEGTIPFAVNTPQHEKTYRICKETLLEIERKLRKRDIAKQSLLDIKVALNDVENAFYDLRRDNKFKKSAEIRKVDDFLIEANAQLQFALEELRINKKSVA